MNKTTNTAAPLTPACYTTSNTVNTNANSNSNVYNPSVFTKGFEQYSGKEVSKDREFLDIFIEQIKKQGSSFQLSKTEKVWNLLKEVLQNDDLLALIKKEPDWLEFV